jgi:hypothetical protein
LNSSILEFLNYSDRIVSMRIALNSGHPTDAAETRR